MIVLVTLAWLAALRRSAAQRTTVLFEGRAPHVWQPVLASANDSAAYLSMYSSEFTFAREGSAVLVPAENTDRFRLEMVRTAVDANAIQPLVCQTRTVRAVYRLEHLSDAAPSNAGQAHKIVFGSDVLRSTDDKWPNGLGFTFAGGGVQTNFSSPLYAHPHPTAFVFFFNGTNTCSWAHEQECEVFERTDLPRIGAGEFVVNAAFAVDRDSGVARASQFTVTQTSVRPARTIFDLRAANLTNVPPFDASQWFAEPSVARSVPRFSLAAHRAAMKFSAISITWSDECETTTTTAAATTTTTTSTSASASASASAGETTSASSGATTSASSGAGATTSVSSGATTSASEAVRTSETTTATSGVQTSATRETSQTSASNALSSTIEPEDAPAARSRAELMPIEDDWLLYAVGGVAALVLTLFLCFCLYACRKRIRKSNAFLCLYANTPCRTTLCCCCASAMEPRVDFELDDVPTPRSVMSAGPPAYDKVPPPRAMYYVPGRGAVPRGSTHVYDQVDQSLMGFDEPDDPHVAAEAGNTVYGRLSLMASDGSRTPLGSARRRGARPRTSAVPYAETQRQRQQFSEEISDCGTDYGVGASDDDDDGDESGYSDVGGKALGAYDRVKRDYAKPTDTLA